MKIDIRDKVLSVHPYKLPTIEQWNDAIRSHKRLKTKVKDENYSGNRRDIYGYTEDELISNLYHFYFIKNEEKAKNSFDAIFQRAMERKLESSSVKPKTIRDLKGDYNRFFKDDPFSLIELKKIKISDLAKFLDRAHKKVSQKDIEREQETIEIHRHSAIRTIINEVYGYANTFEEANLVNPILSLNYNTWPYYKMDTLEKGWYDENDRLSLLKAFDSIKNPNTEDLCIGFILETAARNGEARGIRFKDFHFQEKEADYVRICGLASAGHREERVKADSYAGKRNVIMTDRLKKIYEKAKQISWSDEFLFVRDKKNIINNEFLITEQSVQRALRRLCEASKVAYLPPHQIRFSEATLLALENADAMTIQRRMGHTTPQMSNHYILLSKNIKPSNGPKILNDLTPTDPKGSGQ